MFPALASLRGRTVAKRAAFSCAIDIHLARGDTHHNRRTNVFVTAPRKAFEVVLAEVLRRLLTVVADRARHALVLGTAMSRHGTVSIALAESTDVLFISTRKDK